MERFDEAIRAYSNEVSYAPDSIKALNNRAFCYSKLGDHLSAMSDYESVLGLDAANIHALHNKGILLQRMSKFEKVSKYDSRQSSASHSLSILILNLLAHISIEDAVMMGIDIVI